jgi:hypothetical protein
VAAELTQDANDLQQLDPMLQATAATLAAAGIAERPGTLLADSGYWSIANLTEIEGAPELLIPPAKHARQGKSRKDGKPSASKSDPLRAAMTAKLNSEDGKARYAKRKETVEAVFGQSKDVRGARRLMRRGMAACDAEWKLLCGTHNLLKLWRHTGRQPAPCGSPPEPRGTAAPADSGVCLVRSTSSTASRSAVQAAGRGIAASPSSNTLSLRQLVRWAAIQAVAKSTMARWDIKRATAAPAWPTATAPVTPRGGDGCRHSARCSEVLASWPQPGSSTLPCSR